MTKRSELYNNAKDAGLDVDWNMSIEELEEALNAEEQEESAEPQENQNDQKNAEIYIRSVDPVRLTVNGEVFEAKAADVQVTVPGQRLVVPAEKKQQFLDMIRQAYPNAEII